MKAAFHIFATPIGECAIVWQGEEVIGTSLPSRDLAELRANLARRFRDAAEQAPPANVRHVVAEIGKLLAGTPVDFAGVALSLTGCAEFEQQVYAQTRSIPAGETRTYGEVAAALGSPGASRAVGRALGRNPVPIIVPCHRVLAASGRSGGFSAPGGISTKMRLLQIERARRGEASLFDDLPWGVGPQ